MSEPSLTELLRQAMDKRLVDVHVSMPARVESYDKATQTCSAKPLIRRSYYTEDDERVAESLPIVNDVPVVFYGSGAYSSTVPVSPGDTVLLVFSEGSLDRWLDKDDEVDPEDDRMHSLSDAIAIPGLRSRAGAIEPQPPDDAWVFTVPLGSQLRLGGELASERVIRGDAFRTAFDILMNAIGTATGTTPAVTTFQEAWAAMLSEKVRVE